MDFYGPELIQKIHHEVKGNSLYIYDGVEWGIFIEFGTTGHMVFPKTKKALHWKVKGTKKDAFSKGHYVRGIKAYSPFRKVLHNPQIMRELISKAFK